MMARMWSRTRALRMAQRTPVILLANAMLRAAGTLVFIFVGRISGPEDAGVLSLALGYLAILTTLFTGLDDLLIREVTAAPKRVTALLLAYAVLRLPLTALLSVVVLLIGQAGSQLSPEQMLALRLIVSSAVLDALAGLGQIVLYAFGGFRLLVLPAAVTLLLRAGVGPLLLLAGGFAPAAAMWPLSSVAGAALLLHSARRVIRDAGIEVQRQPVDWSLVRHLGRLVPGFGAVSLLSALEYQLDVILLSKLRSPVDVGMYGAAISIINVVALIPQAYRTVLYPDLVRLQHESPARAHALMSRAARNMTLAGGVTAAVIALAAPWLIESVFGARFAGSQPVMQILIWNVVFLFLNVPLVRYLIACGRQNAVSRALVVSISTNLVANLILIPPLAAAGSAWARLISSLVFVILVGWQAYLGRRTAQTAHL